MEEAGQICSSARAQDRVRLQATHSTCPVQVRRLSRHVEYGALYYRQLTRHVPCSPHHEIKHMQAEKSNKLSSNSSRQRKEAMALDPAPQEESLGVTSVLSIGCRSVRHEKCTISKQEGAERHLYLEQHVDETAEVVVEHAVHLTLGALEPACLAGGGGEGARKDVGLLVSPLDCLGTTNRLAR